MKRLIGDFIVYGDPYDMMRQSHISQKPYNDVTKGKTRKTKFNIIILVSKGILFTIT